MIKIVLEIDEEINEIAYSLKATDEIELIAEAFNKVYKNRDELL